MPTKSPRQLIDELIVGMGLPTKFFWELIVDGAESDWSFVIKLHALIEAVLTHLLTSTSVRPGLEKVYSLLDTSDDRTGKLAFIKALDLLDKPYRQYVRILGEIRNAFVHDVKNVGSTLDDHISRWKKDKLKQFVEIASLGMSSKDFEFKGRKIPKDKFFRENPKIGLWLGAMSVLVEVYFAREIVSDELGRGRVRNAFFHTVGEGPIPANVFMGQKPIPLNVLMGQKKKEDE